MRVASYKAWLTVGLMFIAGQMVMPSRLSAQTPAPADWRGRIATAMPLLGHRNWILIVDSAYPLQTSPGIETVETDLDQLAATRFVLHEINDSIHVRPVIYMDAELPFVTDNDAPGASAYRSDIAAVLRGYPVASELHEKLIAEVAQESNAFHVLVLKTKMTVPYSSIFIRLDCKYWSADAEQRLRTKMR